MQYLNQNVFQEILNNLLFVTVYLSNYLPICLLFI